MLHVVNKINRHIYKDKLEEQFRIRHDIYVKQRKWMALDREDGREIDQFDNEDATYLLLIENNKVIGGSRFVPTVKPHLSSEVFPFLANIKGVQRGENIVEWTRIFIVKENRNKERLNLIYNGVLEYCLDEGYDAITVVMETWWLPRFLALGWDVEPLGLPMTYDGMEILSVIININQQNYNDIADRAGNKGRVLFYANGNL